MDSKDLGKCFRLEKLAEWYWFFLVKTLDAFGRGLFYAAGGSILGGLCILGYQVMFWLRHGTWEPITILATLHEFEFLSDTLLLWIARPTDWVGLSEVVGYALSCSLWWVVMLLAVPLFCCAITVSAEASTLGHLTEKVSPGEA
jgi:hypothetical protein